MRSAVAESGLTVHFNSDYIYIYIYLLLCFNASMFLIISRELLFTISSFNLLCSPL